MNTDQGIGIETYGFGFDQTIEVGSWFNEYSHGTSTFVCPMNTGRGIGTETCGLDSVFHPNHLRSGSDTEHKLSCYM